MTELERFAAVLLGAWQQEGRHRTDPIAVGSLLDRTLPYRTARRLLGIDVSEDYELLVLRLVAEEDALVRTEPPEAAAMARTTLAGKLPDLDLLQSLRSASLTFTDDTAARLDGVRPIPTSGVEGAPAPQPEAPETAPAPDAPAAGVLPLRAREAPAPADATRVAATPPAADAGPPPAFLTAVAFTPPGAACWSCGEALPGDRVVKFCVACGADQRAPTCAGCGESVERHWKFCPECGTGVNGER